MDGLKLEMMKNSMEVPKVFSLENENFMKNTASNDFRIRPQSSMPRLRKK